MRGVKPGDRVWAFALGVVGSRAPGAHPTSSPGLLHLGTAIYPVAKAPSRGAASILLVQPSSPLSAPYSPPEALYVQNVFQIRPLLIRSPTPTLVPGAIASGGARTMASSLAPVPIFPWQRSDPFSRAADWGASLLVHVTAAVAPMAPPLARGVPRDWPSQPPFSILIQPESPVSPRAHLRAFAWPVASAQTTHPPALCTVILVCPDAPPSVSLSRPRHRDSPCSDPLSHRFAS